MQLHEANKRLETQITEEQLWDIHTIYCLLDLDKDEFCKIVDVVGVEALAKRKAQYEKLAQGQCLVREKERHEKNLTRYQKLEAQMAALKEEMVTVEGEIVRYVAQNTPSETVSD